METSWIMGLAGGLMIGTAGAAYLLLNGRIMGASGIVGGLADGSAGPAWRERAAFVLGLVTLPALLLPLIGGDGTGVTGNVVLIVLGGLLVGVGTRLANGCTSGHGVCGISHLSPRGLIATAVYLAAGVATVLLARHGLGLL